MRNKNSRRKNPPNIYASIQSYNKTVEVQQISAHNDSYAFEWTETRARPWIAGREALRIDPAEGYTLTWPIHRGAIDRSLYGSCREACLDLELIWTHAIRSALEISGDLSRYAVMLVIAPATSKWEMKAYTDVLINSLGVGAVSFVLEPVAVTFGAGISSACVVDMGAQSITISCVEEGCIHPGSLVKLDYGGDDVTRLLLRILQLHSFPYEPLVDTDPLDWELINDLREKFCTLDEEEISSLVYEFFVRRPGRTTLHFNFKVLEERLLAVGAMLEEGAPWLTPFEQKYREDRAEEIAKFWTGAYDVDGEKTLNAAEAVESAEANDMEIDVDTHEAPSQELPEAAAVEQGQLGELEIECKWIGCPAGPFRKRFEYLEHISEHHIHSAVCNWANCSTDLGRLGSKCSRLGHFADHLNDAAMATKPALADPFIHVEPPLPAVMALSLVEGIIQSVRSLSSPRMLSSLTLVGGLSLTPSLRESLFAALTPALRLFSDPSAPPAVASAAPSVEFVLGGADQQLDPTFYGWKGGAVASKLEPTQESWIHAQEWRDWGAKLFKERLPFNIL